MRLVALTGQWEVEVVEVVEYRTGIDGDRYALVKLDGRHPSRTRPVDRSLVELVTRGPARGSRAPLYRPTYENARRSASKRYPSPPGACRFLQAGEQAGEHSTSGNVNPGL